MTLFRHTIFTGVEPNMTGESIRAACRFLFLPWRWSNLQRGESTAKVETWLRSYFNTPHAYAVDSGRSALYLALKAAGVSHGDEVLVQGFTCVVVSNAIRYCGGIPVYVDVGSDFNMDPEDAKKKLRAKAKVLIMQHTFGIPAKTDELISIAREHGLVVIEDCAHSLGVKYNGKLTGTIGDIAMLSFGSDKVASCVRGGALITSNEVFAKKIETHLTRLPDMPRLVVVSHLLHYPIFWLGKKMYHIWIGKLLLWLFKVSRLTSWIIEPPEKCGKQVWPYPSKMSNALANILLPQLTTLDADNQRRRNIAIEYTSRIDNKESIPCLPNKYIEANFLRFPLLVNNPQQLFFAAKKQGILLGDWYTTVIAPKKSDMEIAGYHTGDCPNAERLTKMVINLPTDRQISKRDIDRVVAIVNH